MAKRRIITIGADPELFLKNITTGEYIPAYGLVGGTKEKPLPMTGRGAKGFFYQEDGAAFEFNVPPSSDSDYFVERIRYAINQAQTILRASNLKLDLDTCAAELALTPTQLQHPFANRIGCSPDWDGFTGAMRPSIHVRRMGNLRFTGGHIHVGYDTSLMPPHIMAQHLDLLVYAPFHEYDAGLRSRRAEFYGLPGLYRPKPYGLEYRRPSSFWLKNPYLTGSIAELTFNVVYWLLSNLKTAATKYEAWDLPKLRAASMSGNLGAVRDGLGDYNECYNHAYSAINRVERGMIAAHKSGEKPWA